MSENSWYKRQIEYVRKSLVSSIGQPREASLPVRTYTEDFHKHWDNTKSIKENNMKKAEEILKSWSIETTPRLESAIDEARKEVIYEILSAAKYSNARLMEDVFKLKSKIDNMEVEINELRNEILKLKK